MKKFTAFLLALCLLPAFALASGLPDLGGSGLPVIHVAEAPTGALPDPVDLGGDKGEVFGTDYKYTADFICTVYTYPKMSQSFLEAYSAAAEKAGFTAEKTQVEGNEAIRYTFDGKAALLFPDYSGVTMLMVQNGVTFGQPLPQGNYIAFTRNGRRIVSPEGARIQMAGGSGLFRMGKTFEINYHFVEEPVTLFTLSMPSHAIEGDVFKVNANSTLKELRMTTMEDGYLVFFEDTEGDEMTGSKDHFTLKITKMVKTESLVQVEGTFEGVFKNDSLRYENGSFRAEWHR